MSKIEIEYVENGIREKIDRQLVDGRLHLMGHEMKIEENMPTMKLSDFLGVSVISWRIK